MNQIKEKSGWVVRVSMPGPSVDDNTADKDRLLSCLSNSLETEKEKMALDLELFRQLPRILRNSNFDVRVSYFKARGACFLTSILDSSSESKTLGVAIDLGTTKYVLRIVDLQTKDILLESSFDNPQTELGQDILTRIHKSDQSKSNLDYLHNILIRDLNKNIDSMTDSIGLSTRDVTNVSLAGNTAMTHFFLDFEPYWMIREPYIPVANEIDLLQAGELGLPLNPQARVFCFPNAGSYFGGDLFSGIVYSGMHKREEISILVDVGTNAEVVLGNKDWMIACAGAAGPALEGGASDIGMQAASGVIDSVKIDPETLAFDLHTIEDLPPVGICGSAMIDLTAQLFKVGLLDFRGKFVPAKQPNKFREIEEILCLILVPAEKSASSEELLIGQPEIDSLIRSKAAMFTILETLVGSVGVTFQDISVFYVGGTFGNYIDPKSAITIGMLPDIPLDCYTSLGNSSLEGATMILQDPEVVQEVFEVKDKITYLELNVNQEFMNAFSAAKFLPHTDKSRFPSMY